MLETIYRIKEYHNYKTGYYAGKRRLVKTRYYTNEKQYRKFRERIARNISKGINTHIELECSFTDCAFKAD